jgi:MFS family permease
MKPNKLLSPQLEFRILLLESMFAALAGRALGVVLGFQIYTLTKNPLSLGFLGLVEAIPALSLALFGGHVADRVDRRKIILITRAVGVICMVTFALFSLSPEGFGLLALYAVVFVAGIARGFGDPAASAFEAQVIPKAGFVRLSAVLSSVQAATSILGPALAGLAYATLGVTTTYVTIAFLLGLSWLCIASLSSKPVPIPDETENIWRSISEGVRYVFANQVLVGSMALDLIAVLFGGAVALLPVFANDILQVGAIGLGLLSASTSAGTLLVMLIATRYPPTRNAGRNLLLAVAGFGFSIILFAFSRNLYLSMFALALSGAFDGISMIIRSAIQRVMSPEHMRGRIAAVTWIFIGSSNEIGAFESGFAASLLGVVRSVWMGGLVTLGVVAGSAILAPQLRDLRLEDDLSHLP